MSLPPLEETYTPAEIAEALKISEWWVADQCRTKKLRAYKVAGKWRIKPEDFNVWFEAMLHESDDFDAIDVDVEVKGGNVEKVIKLGSKP